MHVSGLGFTLVKLRVDHLDGLQYTDVQTQVRLDKNIFQQVYMVRKKPNDWPTNLEIHTQYIKCWQTDNIRFKYSE